MLISILGFFASMKEKQKHTRLFFFMEAPTSNSPILFIRKVYNLVRGYVCLEDLTLPKSGPQDTHSPSLYIQVANDTHIY